MQVPRPSYRSLFLNRVGVLATMHQKERTIAPILESALGLQVTVPENLDTDVFGTFTREVKRPGDQLQTARLKAEKALEVTGAQVAIASEGSFGPHPIFPALPCNREIVLLLDQHLGLEIVGQVFSTETNYSHARIATVEQALQFAEKAGFPEHGLVVMLPEQEPNPETIAKGITDERQLLQTVRRFLKQSPTQQVHLETDMRAMFNPTRMAVIAQATQDLVQKIAHCCPKCYWPGFELIDRQPGLPCECCSLPTPGIRLEVYRCRKCNLTEEKPFPNGQATADPAQCSYCNP